MALLILGTACRGQQVTSLGGFSVEDGAFPMGLVQGSDGNFYGTSATGAGSGGGSVFRMTPQGAVTILYRFGANVAVADGLNPTAGLVQASDGKFYGTTSSGTTSGGTVFSVATTGAISYLHFFTAGPGPTPDGTAPRGSLVQGADGKLYGTTSAGGTAGKGVIFQLGLDGTYQILHNFGDGSVANDAVAPAVGLVRDAQGNLYGTSFHGGAFDQGAVYKVDTQQRVSILYSFNPSSVVSFGATASKSGGCHPNSKLLLGLDGNLYGTTAAVAGYGYGTIYQVTPTGQETVLHYFGDGSVADDGRQLVAPLEGGENLLVQSANDGTIYGTTSDGGENGKGVLFEMTPAGQVTIVHHFGDSTVPSDGIVPLSGVIFGADGNIYGTTGEGGTNGWTANAGMVKAAATTGSSAGTLTITQNTGPSTGYTTITVSFGSGSGSASAGTTYSSGGAIPVTPGVLGLSGTAYVGTIFKVQPAVPAFAQNMKITGAFGDTVDYQVVTTQPVVSYSELGLPQGLSLDPTTGRITGVILAAPGTVPVNLYAVDPDGQTITGHLLLTVLERPTITSILTAFGSTAAPFSYQITATPDPDTYAATGLPAGLSINPATGLISGTPHETGTFTASLAATSHAGNDNEVLTLTITPGIPSLSSTYVQIHKLRDGTVAGEGTYPVALISGPDSIMAGVTASGGPGDAGTVFAVTPRGKAFVAALVQQAIGGSPVSLILGRDGNYYGTSAGNNTGSNGTFFRVTPDGVLTVLHQFGFDSRGNALPAGSDGATPLGSICEGANGVFYGVTQHGGANNGGTIFGILPPAANQGSTALYSFTTAETAPSSGLVQTSDTDFYGTTLAGGSASDGTVYHFDVSAGLTAGVKATVYNFGSMANDGINPRSELIYHDGYLYGTTPIGGARQRGTVFKLSTAGVETILHNFGDDSVTGDGINPIGALVAVDRPTTGVTLFGATQNGGANGEGTIYELDADQTLTILHSFDDPGTTHDGVTPLCGLCLGADGNLYGATLAGGLGSGTIFAVVANLNVSSSSGSTPLWTLTGTLPAGLTFDNTTGTILGTPIVGAAGGVYRASITSPTNVTTALTYALAQNFQQWSMAKAGTNLVTNAPAADGVVNALKYLFDISPMGSMNATDRAALPTISVDPTSVPGTPYISLTFRQNAAMSGMTVGLESSDDLVTWTPVPSSQVVSKQIRTDAATGDPMMEMGAPMDGSPQQFLRLKVTPQ